MILIVGIVALQAAIPLAEFLNDSGWDEFWKGLRGTRIGFSAPKDYGRPYNYTPSEFHWVIPPLSFAYYCIFPALLLITAAVLRLGRLATLVVAIAASFMFTLAILGLDERWLSYPDFSKIVLFGTIAGVICVAVLTVLALAISRGDDEEVIEHDSSPSGAARNPWRAWFILAAGFLDMHFSTLLAVYINTMIWDMLNQHFNTWAWQDYHPAFFASNNNVYMLAATYYTAHSLLLYVVPFLFIVWAIRVRMRPWCGFVFGLFTSILLALVQRLFEGGHRDYEHASLALVTGQLFGVIGMLALWLYHSKVSKIRFTFDEE